MCQWFVYSHGNKKMSSVNGLMHYVICLLTYLSELFGTVCCTLNTLTIEFSSGWVAKTNFWERGKVRNAVG